MKTFFILLFFYSASVSAQTVVKDTLTIYLNETCGGNAVPVGNDGEECQFQKGTFSYSSKSFSFVKITKEPKAETFFLINPLKVGQSLITVKVTNINGIILSKSFLCIVLPKNQATGFRVKTIVIQ